MFISTLDLFKIGIGPSSSHTLGPMIAANDFINTIKTSITQKFEPHNTSLICILKGSLAYTGKGHATDRAVALGVHEYTPKQLINKNIDDVIQELWKQTHLTLCANQKITFNPSEHIVFDKGEALAEHPNGMVFELWHENKLLLTEIYFSIGGGFICTQNDIAQLQAPIKPNHTPQVNCPYPFDSAASMLEMARQYKLSIAQMKRANEQCYQSDEQLLSGIKAIWESMQACINTGLLAEGLLPGGLDVPRRAKKLFQELQNQPDLATLNDWLCAYAMAVNEENATGHMVVTAPTNGAAGVIPAVLHYFIQHENGNQEQIIEFFLTAAAIGGLIKHLSSISGAEVGCQGEVGSASAMAAAGLCAAKGGTPAQVENAAEIALEHHLGMTCDPVKGLVQIPCIERNGFGAIKAYTAASLALRGNGSHFMPLDSCIAAMKQTGLEMSHKYKETSLGGLAVSLTEC